jgi:uncharacterized cupin superfamily protein
MAKPVRRVVTGHDASGKAVALIDAVSPHVLRYETGGFTATMLWQTAEMPAAFAAGRDRAADQKGVVPPPRGSVLRIVEFPPEDPRRVAALTHRDVFRGLVAPDESLGPARHPFMHRTDTVDYGIVLEGEIDMWLDDSEVHLRAGDVVIQQGTNHAWVNRSGAICRLAFILLDAEKGKGPAGRASAPAGAVPAAPGTPVRRVVTGHDAAGKAIALSDHPNPNVRIRESSGLVAHNLWLTTATPARTVLGDPATEHRRTPPPAGGTILRVTELPPVDPKARFDHAAFVRDLGLGPITVGGRPPRHPFMHRTDTVDYAIVLEGEIDMLLDEDDIHLRAGDVVVQQGTNHGWVNSSGAPCRIAFVLIDGVSGRS